MRFLKSGDIHLKAFALIFSFKGIPESLYYNMSALDYMVSYAIKREIDKFIFSGDIFHTKSIIHSLAQAMFLDFVRKNKNIHFYILDGNHDMSSKSGDGVSALKCCDNEENVTTIHESKEIDNIWCVPWNPKTMYQDIKSGSPNGAPYLISHFGLNEGKLNSGISIVSDVGLKDLRHYTKVFLSHYHAAQEIENVLYCGSLIQLDWGEKNEEKRFLEIDTDTNTVISVPSVGYKKYCEFQVTKDNVEQVLVQVEQLKKEGHNIKIRKKDDVDLSICLF
jgi:DNA repair exonuclease SbcCD nuclease subunit